jgi:hypothetical protein
MPAQIFAYPVHVVSSRKQDSLFDVAVVERTLLLECATRISGAQRRTPVIDQWRLQGKRQVVLDWCEIQNPRTNWRRGSPTEVMSVKKLTDGGVHNARHTGIAGRIRMNSVGQLACRESSVPIDEKDVFSLCSSFFYNGG